MTIPDISISSRDWQNINTLAGIPAGSTRFQIINKGPDVVYIAEGSTPPSASTSAGLPLFPILSNVVRESFIVLEVSAGSETIWARSSGRANNMLISVTIIP